MFENIYINFLVCLFPFKRINLRFFLYIWPSLNIEAEEFFLLHGWHLVHAVICARFFESRKIFSCSLSLVIPQVNLWGRVNMCSSLFLYKISNLKMTRNLNYQRRCPLINIDDLWDWKPGQAICVLKRRN